jgi:hypothetical protein
MGNKSKGTYGCLYCRLVTFRTQNKIYINILIIFISFNNTVPGTPSYMLHTPVSYMKLHIIPPDIRGDVMCGAHTHTHTHTHTHIAYYRTCITCRDHLSAPIETSKVKALAWRTK